MTKPTLPPDVVGFIGLHPRRKDRLALFRTDGSLSNTYGASDTAEDVKRSVLSAGMTVDDHGHVRRPGAADSR